MARLSLSLLGLFQASLDGQPVTGFETAKTRAVLAYLADGLGQAVSRSTLAGLLWTERSEVAALGNLRHVLANLRHAIHDAQASPPFLIIERETIALDPHSDFSVDTGDFRQLVGTASAWKLAAPRSLDTLKQAVSLYRGDFLQGFQLEGSPDFEEWILIRREGYRSQFLDALYELAEASLSQAEYDQAKAYAHRQIEVESWREEAHCQLMQALNLEGRRGEALAQYTVLCSALKKDLGVGPSQETQRLFERIRDGGLLPKPAGRMVESGESPAIRVQVVPARKLHNLPSQLTSFIGREEEIIAVKSLFCDGTGRRGLRLVTLLGPGGTGKTRLALQAAGELGDYFSDGVWWVELAPLADPGLVVPATAHALGIHDQTGFQSLSLLQDFLEPRHLLLIFDNCEHLIGACAQLAEALLQACSELCVLVTSREALGISGETLFHVLPLSFPDAGENPPLETLNQYEAIRLFVGRANLVSPGFAINTENAPVIVQICQCLEGIPLAIELAAARTKLLSVEEIINCLADRFQLLTGGSRTALPRYQTLRASIDWSYELLTPEERLLLQRLSVFAGGWTLEAARSINHGEDIEAGQVLELLGRLVDKSLVNTLAVTGNEMRYRMLETIRQYASEKLVETGEADRARDWHLQYYCELAEEVEWKLRGPSQVQILDQLEGDMDNLHQAMAYSLEGKGKLGWNPETGLRLVAALLWFWHFRGRQEEGIYRLELLLAAEVEERGTGLLTPKRTQYRAKALQVAAWLALDVKEINKAMNYSAESRKLYQSLGTNGRLGYAYASYIFGYTATLYDREEYKKPLEESLAIFQAEGDQFGVAECLVALGIIARFRNDYEKAKEYYETSLTLREQIGDLNGIALSFYVLGLLAFTQGSIEQERVLMDKSLELFSKVHNEFFLGSIYQELGFFDMVEGLYVQAEIRTNETLSLGRKQANMSLIFKGLLRFGELALFQGHYREAGDKFDDGLTYFRKKGHELYTVYFLHALGLLDWATGELEQALRICTEALTHCRLIGDHYLEAMVLCVFGKVTFAQGEINEAQVIFEQVFQKNIPFHNIILFHHEPIMIALEAIAAIAVVRKEYKPGARLLGATEAWHQRAFNVRTPRERQEREGCVITLSSVIGEKEFMDDFSEGQVLSIKQAVIQAQEFILGR